MQDDADGGSVPANSIFNCSCIVYLRHRRSYLDNII